MRNWGRRLAGDYRDSRQVSYYEVAMLGGVPKLARGFVLRSIRKDVSERAQPHFLPLIDDDAPWRSIAGYDQPDAAYLLIVDSAGTVRWQTSGAPTDAAYAELRRHLPS